MKKKKPWGGKWFDDIFVGNYATTTELCNCSGAKEQEIVVLMGGMCLSCGKVLLPCSFCCGFITEAQGKPNCDGGHKKCPFHYIKEQNRCHVRKTRT